MAGLPPTETAKAAEAFHDFVEMGPGRSLRTLLEKYRQRTDSKPPTKRLKTLATWSSQHRWQGRIREAATARSIALLEQAAELDTDTFLRSSLVLNERIQLTGPLLLDAAVKIRESVRPKRTTDINVNVSIEISQLAERLAGELGLTEADVIAEAQDILAEGRR